MKQAIGTGNVPTRARAVTTNKVFGFNNGRNEESVTDKKMIQDIVDKNNKISEKDVLGGLSASKNLPSTTGPGNVNVVCRFRPLNEKEKNISHDLCCEFIDNNRLIVRSQGENNTYKFSFDRIFGISSTQQEVYDYSAKPIIESVLEGFNGTVLAYGQTSSGKTHTMQGQIDNIEQEGIIPRMIRHIFYFILNSPEEIEYTVKISMIEIYQEKIKDLIDVSRCNLSVREDKTKGLYIEDLSEHYVGGEDEVMEIMKIGSENRSIGATNMNEHSSRSHSIFIMTIHQNNVKDLTAKTGKLYLVDLAGSEKISKTGATGLTLEEAKTINKSLTTLGMVINSLTDGKSTHVPYRESKLTRVLQESLGGNSKTCLIITCSPSIYNEAETLSTLRFGLRAKKIKNKPKINKEETLAELKLEIDSLQQKLLKCNKRISQLETYIKNNGLPLPDEDEIINQIEEESKISEEETGEEGDVNTHINLRKEKVEETSETKKDLVVENHSNEIKIIPEIQCESEHKIILNDNSISSEQLILQMKDNYEIKIKELLEKVQSLQSIIEDDAIKIKINHNSKETQTDDEEVNQEENYTSEHNSLRNTINNNNEDNIIEQNKEYLPYIDKDNKEEEITEGLKPIKLIDELFEKIQQSLNDSNPELSKLVDEYKNRINIECKENDGYIGGNEKKQKTEYWEKLLEEEKRKSENEKKIILKVLEDKSERVAQFEIENKDLNDKLKRIEGKLNPDIKNSIKTIMTLEKNLEQLNKMFQHAMAQKSNITLEKENLENKIKKRSEKLNLLEKELCELRDQIRVRDEKLSFIQRGTIGRTLTGAGNVVRILKGGHHLKQSTIDY